MRRVLNTRNASEETSFFAAPSNPSYEDELHALKLKNKQQTPSFFWHAATKLLPFPATFLDRFRHHTTAMPEKEPVHRLPRLGKTGQQEQAKAFSSPSLGALLKFCRYTLLTFLLAAVLFMATEPTSVDEKGSRGQGLQAGGIGLDTKVAEPPFNVQGNRADFDRHLNQAEHEAPVKRQASYDAKVKRQAKRDAKAKQQAKREAEAKRQEEHDALVKQAKKDVWYATDWEHEAGKELEAATSLTDEAKAKNLPSLKVLECELKQAQSNYDEAHAKNGEIKALLGSSYPESRKVTPEEYAAYKKGRTLEIRRGRASVKTHFQCTPSRDAVLKNQH